MSNGSPQGLALSLPMTSIYTNGLEEYLDSVEKTNEDDENVETDHKYFIDDLTLLIYTNRSRGGIAAAQKILDKVYLYFEEKNLCLNYDKTQIMAVRSKQDELPEYFLTDPQGKKIDYVSDVTLLGVEWNEFLNNDRF